MAVLATLQSYKDHGIRLWASCTAMLTASRPCNHSAELDLDSLIKRFGPDFDVVNRRAELLSSLTCSSCGRKGTCEIRLSAPTKPA